MTVHPAGTAPGLAGELDGLAPALRRYGPHGLALVRRMDTLTVHIRDGAVSLLRHGSAGSAVELVGDRRRHLFDSAPTAAALHRLLHPGRGHHPTTSAPAEERTEDCLPDPILTTLPALLEQLADRMLTAPHRDVYPALIGQASREVLAVLRADGTVATDDRLHLELRIGARVRANSTARALRIVSAHDLDLLTADDRHLATADEVCRSAAERISAVDPPEGQFPVVLGPGSPAALLHEVSGHGLEIDVASAPASAYHGPLGRRIASPLVTLIDNPQAPAWAPLYRVDDEGTTAQETVLVDQGVLTGYLVHAEGARRTGHAPTGHGRRIDHTQPALARMGCTYLAAGDSPPEEAVSGIRRGLYVRSIVAGETDMSGGDFTANVIESFLIEHGRITAPVRAASLFGTGTAVLREIDVVCDDLGFVCYGFQCNKLSQFPLTVSVGQPTIRVARMGVGLR